MEDVKNLVQMSKTDEKAFCGKEEWLVITKRFFYLISDGDHTLKRSVVFFAFSLAEMKRNNNSWQPRVRNEYTSTE